MKERDFQEWLRQLARMFGWRYYHTHRSDHSAAGFPDVVMVRGPRLIFAELKVGKGTLSDGQREWMEALRRVEGAETYLWYPNQRAEIEEILASKPKS